MIYTLPLQVRWHETDLNRIVTPSALQMYMQETANHQLHDNRFDLDVVRDNMRVGFLLSRITTRIYLPLRAYERIEVQTWTCPSRGLNFERCFRVLCNGEVAAESCSSWGLMHLDEHRLLRVDELEFPVTPEEKIVPTGVPARFRVPPTETMEKAGTRRIGYADIDYNGHMNNTKYPDMLCDFLPDVTGLRVTGLSLSFLHEAPYGKDLDIYRAPYEGKDGERGYLFRTVDHAGNTRLEALLLTEPVEG
ncbi:MAG: hypothetical protein II955_05760 [Clostridia bacterium]|nr:hypothetical protein [Clostridia bacterium]